MMTRNFNLKIYPTHQKQKETHNREEDQSKLEQ